MTAFILLLWVKVGHSGSLSMMEFQSLEECKANGSAIYQAVDKLIGPQGLRWVCVPKVKP